MDNKISKYRKQALPRLIILTVVLSLPLFILAAVIHLLIVSFWICFLIGTLAGIIISRGQTASWHDYLMRIGTTYTSYNPVRDLGFLALSGLIGLGVAIAGNGLAASVMGFGTGLLDGYFLWLIFLGYSAKLVRK